jgi:hypothetical protein
MAAPETKFVARAEVTERIDMLLALTYAFAPAESESQPPTAWLSSLSADDRRLMEQRAARYARLTAPEQARWLAGTLNRVRSGSRGQLANLDRQVHYSHVAAALQAEPPRIRSLVLRYLPRAMAESAAVTLGLNLRHDLQPDRVDDDQEEPEAVNEEVVAVIRRHFLARFVSAEALPQVTSLDLLSIVQLTRLVRMLGIRETAAACRNVASADALAAFLRQFAAEDNRAIVRQISWLRSVAVPQTARAERAVQEALGRGFRSTALLDRVGLGLLAMAMAESDPERAGYTAQKFPLEIAQALLARVREHRSRGRQESSLSVLDEAETLAGKLSAYES